MNCSCWGNEGFSDPAESSSHLDRRMAQLAAPRLIGRTTAHKKLKRIWDLLMDDETRIIGVHGMVGVGKTAIMKNVYNQLLETERYEYDEVIWVSCHRSFPSGTRERCRSDVETLKHRKRFILILDDLPDAFSLEEIGLTKSNKENGWKLVFTTRSLGVCREMECEEDCIVQIQLLTEEEALELFWDSVNVKGNPTQGMPDIADEIVKECYRLPLLITYVGKKLKRKDERGWAKLLLQVKNSDYGPMGLNRVGHCYLVESMFVVRDILEFCALYPRDWKILTRELHEYIHMLEIGTDLLTAEAMVMYLTSNAYMGSVEVDFEDYHEWGEGFQIHPIYRNCARMRDWSLMLKSGLMLKELPKEEQWSHRLTMVSFMCNNISVISISPKCPKLHTLFLNKNPNLYAISPNFFVHLAGLRILDLRDNYKMEILPDSVSDLVNLQALRLSRCWSMKRVPSVAKLLCMKMLELDETGIEELPHGIEMLVKLRVLKLHSLRLREPIPSDYLSMLRSLTHLQLHL